MQIIDLACRLGYPVFPCAGDKTPTCKHGYLDAVADEARIRQLWRIWPGPLIGVPTGSRTGFDILDIDLVKHPEAERWLEDHREQIPTTRQHRTRSGGLHFLFKHRKDLRCSQGKLCIGVDIRADGGYCIWWPAHVPQAQEDLDRPLADFPEWLFKQLTARPPRPIPAHYAPSIGIGTALSRLQGILRTAAEAEGSSCGSVLFWCANRLRDMAALGEIGRDQFVAACRQLEQAAASAGLPPHEIDRSITNAMRPRS
jgi:hypothetical protein